MFFLKKYKDAQVRAGARLNDAEYCKVLLDVINFLQAPTNNPPEELVDLFVGELLKQYDVDTQDELMLKLQRLQAQAQSEQSQSNQTNSNNNNDNSNTE